MAGIGGWTGARAPADRAQLARWLGEGAVAWAEGGDALACSPRRRAASRGVTDGLASSDELVVAFDGVLTERAVLRAWVERRHLAVTRGHDAELVLLGWRAIGPAILDRLDGTFALAVWSRGARELVLARDRLGGRALAWAAHEDGLCFGSDAARVAARVGAGRDEARVFDFLLQGHPSPPHTWFAGVRALEPGHLLRAELGRAPRATRWFAPSFIARAGAAQELPERLAAVVAAQRAGAAEEGDGPPLVLLDGGAGGAAIAACAGAGARTVSVELAGLEDAGAAQARALSTEHHRRVLAPDASLVIEAVRAVGAPFATAWPLIGRALAAAEVASISAGVGADALAGAPDGLLQVARGGQLGPSLGRALRRGSEVVADVTLSPLRPWISAVAALGGASETPFGARLLAREAVFPAAVLGSLVRPAHRAALFDRARWGERAAGEGSADSQLGRALAYRLRARVAEQVAPGLDAALARADVELRLPFFDRRALELATGLSAAERPRVLEALAPAGVPRAPDADETQLARWMGGPLEPRWREVVLADGGPVASLLEPARLRPLLLADVGWNPGRWRQAMALWSLSAWLSA